METSNTDAGFLLNLSVAFFNSAVPNQLACHCACAAVYPRRDFERHLLAAGWKLQMGGGYKWLSVDSGAVLLMRSPAVPSPSFIILSCCDREGEAGF